MLAEIETGIVDALKACLIAKHVREIDALPDLDGDALVNRFAVHAPAIYVSLGSFAVADGIAKVVADIACVARNASGHKAARQGDGKRIGLYEMLDRVAAIMDGAQAGGCGWRASRVDFVESEQLLKNGLHVGIVRIETSGAALPAVIGDESTADLGALQEFLTFGAQIDVAPHETPEEHQMWLKEPPDHTASRPELIDITPIREE
ncbi:MAG: DUF1834 family protein [Oxalobacter sp.]|nr:MAG: DUF1834 family protein [Oxalobacter sp.]